MEVVDGSNHRNIYQNKRDIKGETRMAITTHADADLGVCFRNTLDKGVYCLYRRQRYSIRAGEEGSMSAANIQRETCHLTRRNERTKCLTLVVFLFVQAWRMTGRGSARSISMWTLGRMQSTTMRLQKRVRF